VIYQKLGSILSCFTVSAIDHPNKPLKGIYVVSFPKCRKATLTPITNQRFVDHRQSLGPRNVIVKATTNGQDTSTGFCYVVEVHLGDKETNSLFGHCSGYLEHLPILMCNCSSFLLFGPQYVGFDITIQPAIVLSQLHLLRRVAGPDFTRVDMLSKIIF
jgi:hypothetical protein